MVGEEYIMKVAVTDFTLVLQSEIPQYMTEGLLKISAYFAVMS